MQHAGRMACVAGCTLLLSAYLLTAATAHSEFIRPVPLSSVRLKPDSQFDKAASLNMDYLLLLSEDDLLFTFRQTANISTGSGAPYYGSWEDPTCEVRGQFLGHYLSATAMLSRHTNNRSIIERAESLVQQLRIVQNELSSGYLSAFPFEHFLRLRNLTGVWAPFYVIHKIMAGLLDQYLFTDNTVALDTLTDTADFWVSWVDTVVAQDGIEHWYAMLDNEFGGMAEVMYNLHAITGDAGHLRLAQRFTKPSFYTPLVFGEDPLANLHANTHLAQANGYAAGYEIEGNSEFQVLVSNFFRYLTSGHSYATGGSNDHEFWHAANMTSDAIFTQADAKETQETCTQYNILKLARYLFRWTGYAPLADFYERAILNGLIGTQRISPHYHSHDYVGHDDEVPSLGDHTHGATARSRTLLDIPRLPEEQPEMRPNWQPAPPVSPFTSRAYLQNLSLSHENLYERNNSFLPTLPNDPDPIVPNTSIHLSQDPFSGYNGQNWRFAAYRQFSGLPVNNTLSAHFEGQNDSASHGPGRLIYLMPLGAGNGKGDSSHAWGDPLHSFWCCYGSGVESMAKLYDSIFFWRPNSAPLPQGQVAFNPPEVYVNQLVSSTLSLVELNLRIELEADWWSSPRNDAIANFTVEPLNGTEPVEIGLKLRLPGWAGPGQVQVLLNKQPGSFCAHAAEADSSYMPNVTSPLNQTALLSPHSSASYCTIRRSFSPGDTIDMVLPQSIRTEPVQDSRPDRDNLRAIMMGPHVMAGLTHNTREITANPDNITNYIHDINEYMLGAMVSLVLDRPSEADLGPRYLRHINGTLQLTQLPTDNNGARLDASWRLRSYCGRQSEQLEMGQELEANVSAGPIALELVSAPGKMLTRAGQAGPYRLDRAQACSELQSFFVQEPAFANAAPTLTLHDFELTGSASYPDWLHNQTELTFRVEPMVGSLPVGAKVLYGEDSGYIIAPLGNLVDERYTAYFSFAGY